MTLEDKKFVDTYSRTIGEQRAIIRCYEEGGVVSYHEENDGKLIVFNMRNGFTYRFNAFEAQYRGK